MPGFWALRLSSISRLRFIFADCNQASSRSWRKPTRSLFLPIVSSNKLTKKERQCQLLEQRFDHFDQKTFPQLQVKSTVQQPLR